MEEEKQLLAYNLTRYEKYNLINFVLSPRKHAELLNSNEFARDLGKHYIQF